MHIIENPDYPYKFNANACADCKGKCCQGESGYIWVNEDDINKISAYLDINRDKFLQDYVRLVRGKMSLIERQIASDNFACVFFNTKTSQCSIYEVRPSQCRSFPFWDRFKNNISQIKQECPGILWN